MSWVKLCENAALNPKILAVGGEAAWLWVAGLCYANRHGTDGAIPRQALPALYPRDEKGHAAKCRKLAAALVSARLWEETNGGWTIHDYEEFQSTSMRERAEDRRRGWRERQEQSRANRNRSSASGSSDSADLGQMSRRDTTVTVTGDRTVTVTPVSPSPVPSRPVQEKTSTVRDVTATSTDVHTDTHSPTRDLSEVLRVSDLVARASDGKCAIHRGSLPYQRAFGEQLATWRYSDEEWQAFGEAVKTREGRDALWPWAKEMVREGVTLAFLSGLRGGNAGNLASASWEPLENAMARGVAGLRSAGTDGASSGHGGAFPGDPEGNSKVWATKTQAERQAAYERFQPCWRAGITSPRSLGWDRFTPEQIDAFAKQLEAQRAVEAERGPALRKAVG